jgi:hypothetical protein
MSLTSVQTAFFDSFGALYAGQLADYGSNTINEGVKSYVTQGEVVFGRGVVKGSATTANSMVRTPFNVRAPLSGSVLADFVGIAVLDASSNSDASNNAVPVDAPTMVAVAELGSGAIIGALVPAGVTIVHGDAVYMSVSHVSIPVGGFTNAAGAGLIAITGATWYGAATASTVGRIKL